MYRMVPFFMISLGDFLMTIYRMYRMVPFFMISLGDFLMTIYIIFADV